MLTIYSGLYFGKWAELWFPRYPKEVLPMPVLCSSSATEIAMIISRKFWKKIFHLLFWCKIRFPCIISSNSNNWGLRSVLSAWKLEYPAHFKPCSHGHIVTLPKISATNDARLWKKGDVEEQKLKGGIIPLAVLLGSHCNLGHHIYKRSFRFPNTPGCSWKSAQSLAQKQIKTKQVVMSYGAEWLTAEIKALLKYNATDDCHKYTRIPTVHLP